CRGFRPGHERKDSTMRVCLFEDHLVADLEPLCLTRPAFELLCGCSRLADKQLRHFDARSAGAIVRPHLAPTAQEEFPGVAVNDPAWLRGGPVVLVNARWLPPAPGAAQAPDHGAPCVGLCGDEVAFAVLTPAHAADCSPSTLDACLERW